MRTVVAGIALLALSGWALADSKSFTSDAGHFAVNFPGKPKVNTQTTKTAVGSLKVNNATYAHTDGNVFMVSYTDFPESVTKPENHKTLLDGIRDGVKGKDGKLVTEEKTVTFGPDKLPGREFTVRKEDAKKDIRYRVVIRNSRVYQVAVIGTAEFVDGKDGSEFLDSFELTK